jgi:DNA polymerase III epsilon subunit-like protein
MLICSFKLFAKLDIFFRQKKNMKRERADKFTDVFKVFWDLETTSRCRSRIVSIGYIAEDDGIQGELLVNPRIHIEYEAYKVHGYSHKKLTQMHAKSAKEQLLFFMSEIESIGRDVVMIAHNGKSFDTHVLRHELERENVPLASNIIGFVDSLHWIRKSLSLKSANIDFLMGHFWSENARDLHGALEDCKILKRIFFHVLNSIEDHTLTYFEATDEFFERTKKWTYEEEVLKDIMEEMYCQIEKTTCKHNYKIHFLDVDNTKCIYKCTNCDMWQSDD